MILKLFRKVAYKARSREVLLKGTDEFMGGSFVIPASEWDPSIRLEPPQNIQSRRVCNEFFQNMLKNIQILVIS